MGTYTTWTTDPSGAQSIFTRSKFSVTNTLPCGVETAFEYDLEPEYKFLYVKEQRESAPSGLQRITINDRHYDDTDLDGLSDLITRDITVNGKTTSLIKDILQARRSISSPEGRTITTLYDPNTLLTTSMSIPGLHGTTYGYDSKGRLTSISTNTRETAFTYDTQGFLETITDPENHATSYTYDPVGRITSIDRPDGSSVGFSYDLNGNMTILVNPANIDHDFSYNKVSLNSAYTTPLSGSYSYVYDKERNLKQINFPSGSQINNIYDKSRLVQIQTQEGNIDFTYSCGTKVDSITNGIDTISYTYDGSLVTSETMTGTLDQTLSYAYNNDFNLSSMNYAGGTVSYTYDNDNLLTGAGSFSIARSAQNGLPESISGSALNLSRTFNGYGEVDSQTNNIGGQGLFTWTLTRNDNGRIIQKTEAINGASSTFDYTYDPMGRLLTVTKDGALVEEYQYNPDGTGTRTYMMNALRGVPGTNYDYSEEDHLLTAGATAYQYDVDGFLVSKTEGTDVTTFDYSTRGELLSVTLPDGRVIEYIHVPLGRRIAKKVNGVITEKYLWQGLTRLLAVYNGSDNLLMRFEYADGRMPVAMTKDGSTYYLAYDQVGSLRMVANSSGVVVKRINYDSFGNIIDDTAPSFLIPFAFAGGLYDADTGLVRFGYRDYDPDIGRWTAKDPILFAGGDTDLYGYSLNNPINLVDPDGLFVLPGPTGALGGTIVGGIAGAILGGISGAEQGGVLGGIGGAIIGMGAGALSGAAGGAITGAFGGLGGGTAGGVAGSLAGTVIGEILSPSPLHDEGAHEIVRMPIPDPPWKIRRPVPKPWKVRRAIEQLPDTPC